MENNSGRNTSRKIRSQQKKLGRFDYTLFCIIIILLVFGLVMIYSTSYYTANLKYKDPTHWLKRQMVFAIAGVIGMIFVSKIDYHIYRKFIPLIFGATLVMLVAVLFIGEEVNGAKRWLNLGVITVQPSEIAKLALIIYMATLLNRKCKKMVNYKEIIVSCIPPIIVIGLVALQNLSTGIVLAAIMGIMLIVACPKTRKVLACGLLAVGVVFIFYKMEPYRESRVEAWLNPTMENAYQTLQSLYAIGSGGMIGRGLGQSLQKLGFIPEAHNDMIFSVICEELGFMGAVSVIALFVVLIYRMFIISCRAKDLYGTLLVVGAIAHIGIQVLINISVSTNVIPNTGVTLPFISYGGTSMIFLLAEMGIVINVSRETNWR